MKRFIFRVTLLLLSIMVIGMLLFSCSPSFVQTCPTYSGTKYYQAYKQFSKIENKVVACYKLDINGIILYFIMKIYLDDERTTPEGFTRTYTVDETISLIKKNNGKINTLSLDNDLGVGMKEGREVLKWIEELAFENRLLPIPHILIHSQNNVAVNDMMKARFNAWKYWTSHGYNRSDYINN